MPAAEDAGGGSRDSSELRGWNHSYPGGCRAKPTGKQQGRSRGREEELG